MLQLWSSPYSLANVAVPVAVDIQIFIVLRTGRLYILVLITSTLKIRPHQRLHMFLVHHLPHTRTPNVYL